MPPATPPFPELSRRAIFAQAWPIMLGQAFIPLVGIVDVAIIGRTGDAAALAGVALGATIINMVFWTFGFLRMGMTGLTAQAQGAGDPREVDALLIRGLAIGLAVGCAILLLQWPISRLALMLLSGGEETSAEAGGFLAYRFIGAPAALCVFAITGWLLGLGRTRAALMLQIVMNLANIALDLLFVWGLDMGARGVGLGTSGAEWIALGAGLLIAARGHGAGIRRIIARQRDAGLIGAGLFGRTAMKRLFQVNRDLMIRTIALLAMFTWLANAGARLGTETLAANHVLLQFVSVAAFVLDAFAFTAEARIGHAIGARSRQAFLRAIRLTGEFSLGAGLIVALAFWFGGHAAIGFIATDPGVRAEASRLLAFAALLPLIGMPGWLLDGIFVGATAGKALRNAALLAAAAYIALDLALRPLGNLGVWIAFSASYLLRAGMLAAYFPPLLRSVGASPALARQSAG